MRSGIMRMPFKIILHVHVSVPNLHYCTQTHMLVIRRNQTCFIPVYDLQMDMCVCTQQNVPLYIRKVDQAYKGVHYF